MKVKIKAEIDTKICKGVKVKITPTEWLLIRKALRCFADDKEANSEDRRIIKMMLNVVPKFVYADATKEGDADADSD